MILIIAGFLRFSKLGEIPAGLHRDEAFLGYNAYSILKTGRDMSGNLLPLHLKSFIYSPAGYSYFAIPSIALFDLSIFSVRFPSAFFGTLTILVLFFLVQELFKSSRLTSYISLLSSLFLAISPWHINLSRTATENVVVTFFLCLGILLYMKWTKSSTLWLLLASFASFALALLLYQAPRAFLPLFIPILMLVYPTSIPGIKATPISGIWRNLKLPIILYFLTILLPLMVVLSTPNLSLRLRTVSLFADQKTQLNLDEYIRENGVAGSNRFVTRLYHNKLIGYADQFSQNYFSHFSYPFLFTDQALPARYRVTGSGLLYLFELPLLLAGLYWLISKGGQGGFILLSWIFLAPIGSSLAFDDVPNLQRTVLMLPAFSMVTALGVLWLLSLMWSTSTKKFFIISLLLFASYNVSFYLHQYFVHLPIHKPWYRHEGYQALVSEVNELLPSYQKAVVTNRESAPTIFFLFYGRYDPGLFQKDTRQPEIPDFDRINFGSYEFSQEECPLRVDPKTEGLTGLPNILYVNYGTCPTPDGTRALSNIKRGDNSVVFRVVQAQ